MPPFIGDLFITLLILLDVAVIRITSEFRLKGSCAAIGVNDVEVHGTWLTRCHSFFPISFPLASRFFLSRPPPLARSLVARRSLLSGYYNCNGLSTGARAGIGIAIAVGILALIGLMGYLRKR